MSPTVRNITMKRILLPLFCTAFYVSTLQAQITDPKATEVWEPQPPIVTPGENNKPPSDAIVLFDGSNMDAFVNLKNGKPSPWTLRDGVMTVKPDSGNLVTRDSFGDCQLHLEFRTPVVVKGEGQGRGNSGIWFQDRYEIQILDNYQNKTYSNGQVGAIYKQTIPLVNPSRKPGEWQTYDILYTAPRFNKDGMLVAPARITALLNGVVVQLNTEIKGPVEFIGLPVYKAHGKAPIRLQDHGDLVGFRNIWIREL